jgi:hypothetical protein
MPPLSRGIRVIEVRTNIGIRIEDQRQSQISQRFYIYGGVHNGPFEKLSH